MIYLNNIEPWQNYVDREDTFLLLPKDSELEKEIFNSFNEIKIAWDKLPSDVRLPQYRKDTGSFIRIDFNDYEEEVFYLFTFLEDNPHYVVYLYRFAEYARLFEVYGRTQSNFIHLIDIHKDVTASGQIKNLLT